MYTERMIRRKEKSTFRKHSGRLLLALVGSLYPYLSLDVNLGQITQIALIYRFPEHSQREEERTLNFLIENI